MAGHLNGGTVASRRSAMSVPSTIFSVDNPSEQSDTYLVPNFVYQGSTEQPSTAENYQSLASEESELNLRSDHTTATQHHPHVMNLSAQKINDDYAKTHLVNDVREKSPKGLILDHNMIRRFPEELCHPSIEVLSVQSQVDPEDAWQARWPALAELPSAMGNMSRLLEINFTNNALEYLPDSLATLQNLRNVDLRLNYFRMFPTAVLESKSIHYVNLTGNYIKVLPVEICQMEQLEVLMLDNNELEVLPDHLHALQNLTVLSIRNNKRLNRLPKKLHECPSLKQVFVEGNNMEYPPEQECQKGSRAILAYLKRGSDRRATNCEEDSNQDDYSKAKPGQILPLRNLRLNSLETVLEKKGKPELEVLDVRDNKLTTLPDSLDQYKMLQVINCDNNHIVQFPLSSLRKAKALKKLNLSSQHDTNRRTLCTIPMMICKLSTLQELYLRHNKITKLEPGICHLKSLRVLDLEGNYLKTVPKVIENLKKLEYLGLNSNELSELPDSIGTLQNLKVLRLSKNAIQELPDSLCVLTNLQTLSLRNNQLVRLPTQFYKLQKLLVKDVFETETTGVRFPNGCSLDKNLNLKFPPPDIVREGLQHIMDYIEIVHTSPEILDEDDDVLDSVSYREPSDSESATHAAENPPAIPIQTPPEHSLSDQFLNEVSRDLGPEWAQLAMSLGLPYNTVQIVMYNHPNNVRHQSMNMLFMWRNEQTEEAEAQKRHLVKGLKNIRRNDLATVVENMNIRD